MILFFKASNGDLYLTGTNEQLSSEDLQKLTWLYGGGEFVETEEITGKFIGPRQEMLTPWSTNAVEITQNMGISGIFRIEQFQDIGGKEDHHDPMLERIYEKLDQDIFTIEHDADPLVYIENIAEYNAREGLALSDEEIEFLESVSDRVGRKLTDSEVFGFSQVNSEHCRHKIFNGTFIVDGEEQPYSLFQLIRKTSERNENKLVSAYKDNVAFVKGPKANQFAPATQNKADYFRVTDIDTVISLKAETHNFPTTVEPFNGAATGSGGEIRDRMAGGIASIPLAGTAVYMTSYSRLEDGRRWEKDIEPRPWLYQTPLDILIKASNGASDFGNKFGQPLISGSLLTFEHEENQRTHGFDKVIMLAGGIGYGKASDSLKKHPETGDRIVVMGGDNYRIGMGGGAVSSVATGEYDNAIELNAIQRSNPEMQKRVYNAIRAMSESEDNPIISLHDHGAGGHLNCLSELVEDTGGKIDIDQLPVGDPTLSDKEVIGNESQERMGLIVHENDLSKIESVAKRERAPFYNVGEVTGDDRLVFASKNQDQNPIDLDLEHMFGSSPKTILEDVSSPESFGNPDYDIANFRQDVNDVLQLEAVACKDWLTNKVDRSVTGKVATQQTTGEIQLPLNNVGVMAIDYQGVKGVATSIGHAPIAALIDPEAGSRLAVTEALTNLIWAPITDGLLGVSLSANWMWPAKRDGENARLYKAVNSLSRFCLDLGINVPTGKDSLSMTQKYSGGKEVLSPGTVIVSSVGEVTNIRKTVTPEIKGKSGDIVYVDLSNDGFHLGGSSLAQLYSSIGSKSSDVHDSVFIKKSFNAIQELIHEERILAGHDISAGGLVTTLLEMCFPTNGVGLDIDTSAVTDHDLYRTYFAEQPGLVLQVANGGEIKNFLKDFDIECHILGQVTSNRILQIQHHQVSDSLDIDEMRDSWMKSSYLLDQNQTRPDLAKSRFEHYKSQVLDFKFPSGFSGNFEESGLDPDRRESSGIKAAIIREKGVNGDREMAWSMYLAGFDVKDIHMTDLVSGAEDLTDVNFIVFVGGFSNSDVLGSAKGWAGAFLYNEKAKQALDSFYKREDTLSLGVCNGCQLMMELELIYPKHEAHPKMLHNESGKFESSFLNVDIPENNSVMMKSLSGARLGIWVAHGEGKFQLPESEQSYNICGKYSYSDYPGNPNGSDYNTAIVSSHDGRHLAMMPHLERAILPWQWAHYPGAGSHDYSPWLVPFIDARRWIEDKIG